MWCRFSARPTGGLIAPAGRVHAGDRVLLAAFGAGLVWGGVVVTWGRPAD